MKQRHFIEGHGFVYVTDSLVNDASDRYVAAEMWLRDARAARPLDTDHVAMYVGFADSARNFLNNLRNIQIAEGDFKGAF